jgi:uncharacterized membrane protein
MLPLVASLFLAIAGASPNPRPWCSGSEAAEYRLDWIRTVVSKHGIEADSSRRIYHLPELPADSVVLVTDERVCERAARAYYRHELGPMPAGGVTVIRVANRYVVSGALRAGEWSITTIYSTKFEPIANILS